MRLRKRVAVFGMTAVLGTSALMGCGTSDGDADQGSTAEGGEGRKSQSDHDGY